MSAEGTQFGTAPELRSLTPQSMASSLAAMGFDGLPAGVTRSDLMRVLELGGPSCGLTSAQVQRLEAVDGTAWERAVMEEVARQVMRLPEAVRMTEGARSEAARARFFLRLAAREIGEALKGDDRMRRAVCGDAAQDARMTRGGGTGFSHA